MTAGRSGQPGDGQVGGGQVSGDWTDEALLGELRGVLAQVDPVPGYVLEAARAAFGVRDLDQELATLAADSASTLGSPAPVRALLTLRTLSFEASETGVELELSAAGKRFDLQGQVLGGVRGPVMVDHSEGAAQAEADELGWCEVRGVGAGQLRVRWTDGAGRATVTAWFET